MRQWKPRFRPGSTTITADKPIHDLHPPERSFIAVAQ